MSTTKWFLLISVITLAATGGTMTTYNFRRML